MNVLRKGFFILAVLSLALGSSVTAFAADSKYVDVKKVYGGRMNVHCPGSFAYSDAEGYTGTLSLYKAEPTGNTYYINCYYSGNVSRP